MSDKRKKKKFAAKRRQRRLNQLAREGRLEKGQEIPIGAVAADQSQQGPYDSYMPGPLYYVDVEFTCRDCGSEEVWTAEQQKWYYEVANGSLYATAVRCRDCRNKLKDEQNARRGEPNPSQHVGSLIKQIRTVIEPALTVAGFAVDPRNQPRRREPVGLDYSRPDMLFRFLYERSSARLVAESVDDAGTHHSITVTDMDAPRSTSEILERIDEFTSAIIEYLSGLPPADAPEHSE